MMPCETNLTDDALPGGNVEGKSWLVMRLLFELLSAKCD